MKSIVTGGAGFIGSHLVDRLLDMGHRVLAVDDMANGSMRNLARAEADPAFELAVADVADAEAMAGLFDGADWVFHLAGLADIVPSVERPLPYHRANVDGTVSVLEASRHAGVKRFVYAASSSCYGLAEQAPTPEDAPLDPQYPYALTKLLGEQCVLHWDRLYGLPCLSLRLFNVYGPRARTDGAYGGVFKVFLAQKLAGEPFTVVGDGEQTRDFVFISDVVEAFVAAAASDVHGRVYNVGSGGSYSVNRLVELLGGDKVHIPRRPGEPDATWADITRITSEIGWRPRVSFEQGVAVMVENIHMWADALLWDADGIAEATRNWFTYLGKKE